MRKTLVVIISLITLILIESLLNIFLPGLISILPLFYESANESIISKAITEWVIPYLSQFGSAFFAFIGSTYVLINLIKKKISIQDFHNYMKLCLAFLLIKNYSLLYSSYLTIKKSKAIMSDLEQMGKAAEQVLTTNGSGTLSWAEAPAVSFWSIFSILIITTLAYSLAKEIMIKKTILNK
tara:strand:- start:95 stop:637 length:543 start_codon:yes stop_codon:yes gene_type:complete